jgi:hypothetical protein
MAGAWNEKCLIVTWSLATGLCAAVGGATGASVPFNENTHSASPRGRLNSELPPDATAMYCVPLTE